MKKSKLFTLVAILAVFASTAIGCDNRSQAEKDADKAMKKLDEKLGN